MTDKKPQFPLCSKYGIDVPKLRLPLIKYTMTDWYHTFEQAELALSKAYEHKDFEQCEKSCPFVSQHKMEGKLDLVNEAIALYENEEFDEYEKLDDGEYSWEGEGKAETVINWLKSQLKCGAGVSELTPKGGSIRGKPRDRGETPLPHTISKS